MWQKSKSLIQKPSKKVTNFCCKNSSKNIKRKKKIKKPSKTFPTNNKSLIYVSTWHNTQLHDRDRRIIVSTNNINWTGGQKSKKKPQKFLLTQKKKMNLIWVKKRMQNFDMARRILDTNNDKTHSDDCARLFIDTKWSKIANV